MKSISLTECEWQVIIQALSNQAFKEAEIALNLHIDNSVSVNLLKLRDKIKESVEN